MKNRAKRIDMIVIAVVVSVFLVVIGTNISLIFSMISSQTEQIGETQLDVIKSDLQGALSDAENSLMRVAISAEQLMNEQSSKEFLREYIYRQKQEQMTATGGAAFNVYIAGEDWEIIPDFDVPEDFHSPDRLWYIGAKENYGEVYITEPYIDRMSGEMCFTVSTMLSDHETVLAMDFNLSEVQNSIREMSGESHSDALIVTNNGMIVGYTDMSIVGSRIGNSLPEYEKVFETVRGQLGQHFRTRMNGRNYTVFSSKTDNDWYMILSVDNATLYRDSFQRLSQNIAINILMLLIVVAFYLLGARNRNRAEEALVSRERFLSKLTGEFKEPIRRILKISDTEVASDREEIRDNLNLIRESGLQLSEMVDNLFSYSSIQTDRERMATQRKVDVGQSIQRMRNLMIMLLILTTLFSIIISFVLGERLSDSYIQSEMMQYDEQLNQWATKQTAILNMYADTIAANPSILDDYDQAVEWLDRVAKNYPEISVCYMTNPYKEQTVVMNNGWKPDDDWKVEERQWYIDTEKSENGFNISDPYYDAQTGNYCITFSKIVYGPNNEFLGIFGIDFFMDRLIGVLGEHYSTDGYAFLVDNSGNIINHPNKKYEMTDIMSTNVMDTEYAKAFEFLDDNEYAHFWDYNKRYSTGYVKKNKSTDFYVFTVNDWWATNSVVVLLCVSFMSIIALCMAIIVVLINRTISWQADTNKRMEEAMETAVAAGKAKSDFLAQMSHEIRTPINAVIGMDEMILRESTDEDILEYAVNIQSAGRTLLNLINGILDFSKIESGKMEIIQVKYDTIAMVDDLVHMISEKSEKKGLELKTEIEESIPCTLYGDDLRVRQVITNILSNAVKYTKEGSVTLRIGGEIIDRDHYRMDVEVSDTGIGIKEEDIDKLFLSFQRLDEEKNRSIEGTGLGISIVQGLLAMMGSKLVVQSEYGKGSSFAFSIEQGIIDGTGIGNYEGHRRVIETAQPRKMLQVRDAQILVVDDNEMNLKVVQGLMKRCGLIPDLCDSGSHCLEMVKNKAYHIIFMDHMMPEMDGIETLRNLKKEYLIGDDTVVIALTANAIVGARESYLQEGFADYLSKPIDSVEMEHMLAKYLPETCISYVEPENLQEEEEKNTTETVIRKLARAGFNTKDGIAYAVDDPDFYVEMVTQYEKDAIEKKHAINVSFVAENWKNYETYVHGLKSTSRTIGADALSTLAFEQERAAREGDIHSIVMGYDAMMGEYERVIEVIGEVLSSYHANAEQNAGEEIGKEELQDCFKHVFENLEDYETDLAAENLEKLKGHQYHDHALDALLEPIWECLDGFEAAEASRLLREVERELEL